MNSRRSPKGIGERDLPDESADLDGNSRPSSTRAIRSRKSGPKSAKTFPLPADHSVRLNEDQRATPTAPNLGQADPEQPIQLRHHRPFVPPLLSGQLQPQREVLDSDGLMPRAQ